MKPDQTLFRLVDKRSKDIFKKFKKFYENDSKPFMNKVSRDYEESGKFPGHVLETIKNIDKNEYDSVVCVLRGGIPYTVLFEALGWKVHYVLCGRRNEKFVDTEEGLRFSKSVDTTLPHIRGKKVLLIENNSLKGISPGRVAVELKKSFGIKRPDLFLDYFVPKLPWAKDILRFENNPNKLKKFGKIFVAKDAKVKEAKRRRLVEEFLEVMG